MAYEWIQQLINDTPIESIEDLPIKRTTEWPGTIRRQFFENGYGIMALTGNDKDWKCTEDTYEVVILETHDRDKDLKQHWDVITNTEIHEENIKLEYATAEEVVELARRVQAFKGPRYQYERFYWLYKTDYYCY